MKQIWNKVELNTTHYLRFSLWQSIKNKQTQLRHNLFKDCSPLAANFIVFLKIAKRALSTFLQFMTVCCKKRP